MFRFDLYAIFSEIRAPKRIYLICAMLFYDKKHHSEHRKFNKSVSVLIRVFSDVLVAKTSSIDSHKIKQKILGMLCSYTVSYM